MSALSSRFRYLILVVALVLAFALAAMLIIKTRTQAPARPAAERTWSVTTLTAQAQTLAPELVLYGEVEAPRTAQLSAAITAFVASQAVDEGEQVYQGQLLLTLDDRDARLLVASREAQRDDIQAQLEAEAIRHNANLKALKIEQKLLALAERAVARIEQLKGRQVSSQTQLDDAQRAYEQQALALNNRQREIDDYPARRAQLQAQLNDAQAQLDSATLDLERTQIKAPFDGRIARIDVAPGNRVRSGDPLLTLFRSDRLEVRTQIPTSHLATIRAALAFNTRLTATAKVDGHPLTLRLDRLAAVVGSGRAGVDALFRIETGGLQPEPGRTLDLRLTLLPRADLYAIPAQALYGTDRLFRVVDERLEALTVNRVGERQRDGNSELLVTSAALQDGDQILTLQLPNAMTGLRVQVTER